MAIAFVQEADSGTSVLNQTSTTVTVTATGLANLVVVCIFRQTAQTVASVTDSKSSTYTHIVAADAADSGGASMNTHIWYLANCPSGITSVTVTYSGSVFNWVGILEYSGAATSSALDVAGHVGTGAGAPYVGPSLTTTRNGDGIVAFISGNTDAITGVSSPFTSRITRATGQNHQLAIADDLGPVAGTYQASFLPSNSNNVEASSGAAFFLPAVAGAGTDAWALMGVGQ